MTLDILFEIFRSLNKEQAAFNGEGEISNQDITIHGSPSCANTSNTVQDLHDSSHSMHDISTENNSMNLNSIDLQLNTIPVNLHSNFKTNGSFTVQVEETVSTIDNLEEENIVSISDSDLEFEEIPSKHTRQSDEHINVSSGIIFVRIRFVMFVNIDEFININFSILLMQS